MKTCRKGHLLDDENSMHVVEWTGSGENRKGRPRVRCRTCTREAVKRHYERNREALIQASADYKARKRAARKALKEGAPDA